MIQHDYMTNVEQALGRKAVDTDVLRFGAEVETGWESEKLRDAFFGRLSQAGLDKLSISKFDRSIAAAACSEIVTLPMRYMQLANTLTKAGEIIEESSGMSTRNCGVHIHATRKPMTRDQFWRVVTAIMVGNKNVLDGRGHRWPTDVDERVEEINRFWDKIALRKAGDYCKRTGYTSVSGADGPGNHAYAVIRGKHTPTVEFRLFKACRSRVVLASYPEVVAALIEFARNPDEKLLVAKFKEDPRVELAARLREQIIELGNLYFDAHGVHPRNTYHSYLRDAVASGYSWETVFGTLGIREVEGPLRASYSALATAANSRLLSSVAGIKEKARDWAQGLFPVKEFVQYVMGAKDLYPNLAARLELDKFGEFTGKSSPPPLVDIEFNETEKHDKVRPGCLISSQNRDQFLTDTLLRVFNVIPGRGRATVAEDTNYTCQTIKARGTSSKYETYNESYEYEVNGSDLLHLCSGATRKEGHDE